MRLLTKVLLAGLGGMALAGTAYAAEKASHVMAVPLADGSVMHIRYFGDKKPQLAVVPPELQTPAQRLAAPVALVDPFDQMFAAMDAQADAMMRQVAAMAAQRPESNGNLSVTAHNLPAGSTVSYSFYSSSNGQGGCTQSFQMTSYGDGAKPQVVEQRSGDCSALNKPAINASTVAPAQKAPAPDKADHTTI